MAGESDVTVRASPTVSRRRLKESSTPGSTLKPPANGYLRRPRVRWCAVEIDACVGGKFAFVDRRDGEDIEHVGEYHETDRPRRLVFTFAVPRYSSVVTRVTIDISPTETGCDLTLTHDGVLPEWASQTESGWTMILEGLERAIA